MKNIALLLLIFAVSTLDAQMLPIDFETSIVTTDFVDFDGGTATVIPNPQANGINTSTMVAQIIRDGGTIWSGSKIQLADNLDFSTSNIISMKVFTTAPIGTTVKFKLEGAGAAERDAQTTTTNEWETLTWDFTGTPTDFNFVVFMFDFGNVGDGSLNSTFLFDDVEQLFGGAQIDLPVDFEGTEVNYAVTDFEGSASSLITDPTNADNTVIKVVKDTNAGASAGTTIGTPAGFASNIPLSLSDSKMTVKVWSPVAGTPIRLKVEDWTDPTHTCETQTNTSVAGWEVLEFDFSNQAPGTESLSVGLSMGWTYNMASIFFNFGTDGAAAGEQTYYFDDVKFGELIISTNDPEAEGLYIFPNPTRNRWTINSENTEIILVEIFDIQGKPVLRRQVNTRNLNVNTLSFAAGIYIASITTNSGIRVRKLIKR